MCDDRGGLRLGGFETGGVWRGRGRMTAQSWVFAEAVWDFGDVGRFVDFVCM